MKITTKHSPKSHQAFIDGVWSTTQCNTEISMVLELKSYGLDIKDAKHVSTIDDGGECNFTHHWVL